MNNKTVIISCAGMGKRLGLGIPKALLEVDGKPLIIRNLEMLDECDDVRVVVGYKAADVIKMVNTYRKDVTFVFNNNYMNNGTGASVTLGAKYSKEYILTIDGDLLIHPDDMKKILNETEEFIGVCKASTDNPVLTSIENGNVIEFSRERGQYEWTGVALLKASRLNPGEGHVYQLIEPLLPLKHKVIRTKEVDTMNDFENAQRWVRNNFSDNITIGIIGGMGSYATVDFFDRIVKAFPAEKEWERPRIVVDNRCNMPSRVRAIIYNERRNELVNSISQSVNMLIKNNVDYIVLACNTSHVFIEDVYNNVPESKGKIVHIIETCAKEIKNLNIKKVKLYASEGTIQSKIYDDIFTKYNIEIEKTQESEFAEIRKWIEAVKTSNINEETIKSFIEKINSEECKNVVLGCTELPILYNKCKEKINTSVFDPLESTIQYLKEKQAQREN